MILSAALIVKNEAERLPACLAAVRPFVDEVIIADGGSSDGSVEIAEDAGAVVHHHAWRGSFAEARNFALERCSGDWVISMDADMIVTGFPANLRDDLCRSTSTMVAFACHMDGHWQRVARLLRRGAWRYHGAIDVAWPIDGRLTPPEVTGSMIARCDRTPRSVESLRRNMRISAKGVADGDTDPYPGYPEQMAALSAAMLGQTDEAHRYEDAAARRFEAEPTGLAAALYDVYSRMIARELHAVKPPPS